MSEQWIREYFENPRLQTLSVVIVHLEVYISLLTIPYLTSAFNHLSRFNTASNPTRWALDQLHDSARILISFTQSDPQFHQILPAATNSSSAREQSFPTGVSASKFSSSLHLQGRRQAPHQTTMASLQLVKMSSRRGDGARGPQNCIASSTTTCPKRSDSVSTSMRSLVQHGITFTQVAYNLDDAPPAYSVAKFREVGEDAPCFPPQFSYSEGDPSHQCKGDLKCFICGNWMPNQPAHRAA